MAAQAQGGHRHGWGVRAAWAAGAAYLAGVALLSRHLRNTFDWDSYERALDSQLVREVLGGVLAGRIRSAGALRDAVLAFRDTYTAGGGIITWPPLQVAILTGWSTVFGSSEAAFMAWNFLLAVSLAVAIVRLARACGGGATIALALVAAHPTVWFSIPSLNLRIGEALVAVVVLERLSRFVTAGERRALRHAGWVLALGLLYRETVVLMAVPMAIGVWLAARRTGSVTAFLHQHRAGLAGVVLLAAAPIGLLAALSAVSARVGLPGYYHGIVAVKARQLEAVPEPPRPGWYGLEDFYRAQRGLADPAKAGLAGARFRIRWTHKMGFALDTVFYHWRAMAIVVAGLLWAWRTGGRPAFPGPIPVLVAVALGTNLLFYAWSGSVPSYFVPAIVFGALLAGILWDRARQALSVRQVAALMAAFVLVLVLDGGRAARAITRGDLSDEAPRLEAGPIVHTILADLGPARGVVFAHTTAAKPLAYQFYRDDSARRVRLRIIESPAALPPAVRQVWPTDRVYLVGFEGFRPLAAAQDAELRGLLQAAGLRVREVAVPRGSCAGCDRMRVLRLES